LEQDGVIDAAERFRARIRPLAEILESPVDQVTRDELDRAFARFREQDAGRKAELRERLRLIVNDLGEAGRSAR
jgi:Fanconi anemia protein nuclease-like protein